MHRIAQFAFLIVVATTGCFGERKLEQTVEQAANATIQSSSGVAISFSSADQGTVIAVGDRINVVRRRNFTISGVAPGLFVAGDPVFIDLMRRLKDGKLSSCANAVTKIDRVADGKATFRSTFYTTDLAEQDFVLRIEAVKPKTSDERVTLIDVECRIVRDPSDRSAK